jgi:hypothetical protein
MTNPVPPPFSSKMSDSNHDVAADDTSVATVPAGVQGPPSRNYELRTIRFRFETPQNSKNAPTPVAIHTQWMLELSSEFGDDIRFIDNVHSQRIHDLDPVKWSNPEQHKKHFNFTKQTVNTKYKGQYRRTQIQYLVHRVQTKVSLYDIKNASTPRKILKDNNTSTTEHYWDLKDTDLKQIGFAMGYNPQYYERRKATEAFKAVLQSKLRGKQIPKFELIQVHQRAQWDEEQATTKCYSLEVRAQDVEKMVSSLSQALKEDPGLFIPYKLRRVDPESYFMAVKQQNIRMLNQHTIVLKNIHTPSIFYLENLIKAVPGVQDIVEARTAKWQGRVNVLVDRRKFKDARQVISENLEGWIQTHVPESCQAPEGAYPGSPEVSMPKGDTFSSGECSYMTASVASLRSFDACFEVEITTPGDNFYHRKNYLEHAEVPKYKVKQGNNKREGNRKSQKATHQSVSASPAQTGIPKEFLVDSKSTTPQKNKSSYAEATQNPQHKHSVQSGELLSQAPTVSEITVSEVQTSYSQEELVRTVSMQSQQISDLMASLQDMSNKYQEIQMQNQQDIRSLMRMFEIKMAVAARGEMHNQQDSMTPEVTEVAERKRMSMEVTSQEEGEIPSVKRTDIKQSPLKPLRPHAGSRPILLDHPMSEIGGLEISEEGFPQDHTGTPKQAGNDFNPQSFEENGLQDMNHD